MEKIKSSSKVDINITLTLSEEEAKALYNMTVYGSKHFTDWFYQHLGKFYLKPHEKGLESLFETIKKELPKHLDKAKEARKALL